MDDKAWMSLLRSATSIDFERAIRPQVGDTVIDASRFDPDPTMVGILQGIEEDKELGTVYHVTSLDGEKQRWFNADARTVRRAD